MSETQSIKRKDLDMLRLVEAAQEIERRGGEVEIVGRYGTEEIKIMDKKDDLILVGCEGWRQYSRAFGARRARLAYLCGTDDNGAWAVRVPGTLTQVCEAINWIEPAQVKKARDKGKRILRQGDVYAVESRSDVPRSIESHEWHHRARVLLHTDSRRQHAPLHVPFRCRMYQQRAYRMGRDGRFGSAD